MATKTTRPKAAPLPGMEASAIPAIERAATAVLEARESAAAMRKEAGELEGAAEKKLITALHKNNKTVYVRNLDDGRTLEVRIREGAEKALVRHRKTRAPKLPAGE